MLRLTARALRAVAAQPAARRSLATGASAPRPAAAASRATVFGLVAAGGIAAGVAATMSAPAQCFWWGGGSGTDWAAVDKDIREIIEDNDCGPILVRLAWHASGTYDKATGTGGSNGSTMRFAPEAGDDANAGLDLARDLLEPLKAKYPTASCVPFPPLVVMGVPVS